MRWPPPSRRKPKARKISVQIIRNGSRGLFWLEPLVEVETAAGPRGLWPGRSQPTSPRCSRRSSIEGGKHKLALGLTEDHPYLKNQERLTFARCGITDPLSIADYIAHGGFAGLQKALDHDAAPRS